MYIGSAHIHRQYDLIYGRTFVVFEPMRNLKFGFGIHGWAFLYLKTQFFAHYRTQPTRMWFSCVIRKVFFETLHFIYTAEVTPNNRTHNKIKLAKEAINSYGRYMPNPIWAHDDVCIGWCTFLLSLSPIQVSLHDLHELNAQKKQSIKAMLSDFYYLYLFVIFGPSH